MFTTSTKEPGKWSEQNAQSEQEFLAEAIKSREK